MQEEDKESSLHLYRRALQARRQLHKTQSEIIWREDGDDGLLIFERGDMLVFLNTSQDEKSYAVSGDLRLSSHSGVISDGKEITLPPSTACWVALS